jgi:hypothetical protein
MTQSDAIWLSVIGGALILMGVLLVFWDRAEQRKYFTSISHHTDTREYLDGWPKRPQFGALSTGGWISAAVGIVLLVGGGILHLWG